MIALQVHYPNKKASESAADQTAQNRDGETVAEIRAAFAGDRQDGVRDARAQIARGINGESGSAAQARADGPYRAAHQERN